MAGLKILLVDDEADFRKLMSARIKKEWGCHLINACDGKEAVEAVKDKNPDIVILDYMLPDIDGVSVLKKIRKINKKVPVIMFTAYPEADAIQDAEHLGISAFIPKLSAYADAQGALKTAINMIKSKIEKE